MRVFEVGRSLKGGSGHALSLLVYCYTDPAPSRFWTPVQPSCSRPGWSKIRSGPGQSWTERRLHDLPPSRLRGGCGFRRTLPGSAELSRCTREMIANQGVGWGRGCHNRRGTCYGFLVRNCFQPAQQALGVRAANMSCNSLDSTLPV